MPKGSYRTSGGGETVFSYEKCFAPPATRAFPGEKKSFRAKADAFSGARVMQYDYRDAFDHCAKRHMRVPTVQELGALFLYANVDNGAANGSAYAIVAPTNDSRYPGGLHGWGGGSPYWTHTFAGKGRHKVVDLGTGRVISDHDNQRIYVSCVH